MLFYIVCATVALLLILIYTPVKSRVVIEGKFASEKVECALFPEGVRCRFFSFCQYCKSCFEEWRKTGVEPQILSLDHLETVGVPVSAWNFGEQKMEAGKSYKLTVYKTVFGTIRAYRIDPSDFVWTDPREEEIRLEALKQGFDDVGKYKEFLKQQWLEEFTAEIMKEENLTREEAGALEPFWSLDMYTDKEAKRRGMTFIALRDEEEEIRKKWYKKFEEEREKGERCYDYLLGTEEAEKHARNFMTNGKLSDEETRHLNQCSGCNNMFATTVAEKTGESEEIIRKTAGLRDSAEVFAEKLMRDKGITSEEHRRQQEAASLLRWGGPDCITLKERIAYARAACLRPERMAHAKGCEPCMRMIEADRRDYEETSKIGGLAAKAMEESRLKNKN